MSCVVTFPMSGRHKMVKLNIELLLKENCTVLIGIDRKEDLDFIRSLGYDQNKVQIVPTCSEPLGKKFQECVHAARKIGATTVIVTGSDDILSSGFIQKGIDHIRHGDDFLCLNHWFIYDPKTKKEYQLRYKMTFPLGGGRVFSQKYLDRVNWKVYDDRVTVRTDDFAWDNLMYEDKITFNVSGMNILSIKGNWETMNSLDAILKSENIQWKEIDDIDSYFKFDKPIKEIFAYDNIH